MIKYITGVKMNHNETEIKLVPFNIEYAGIFFKLIEKNRIYLKKTMGWLDETNNCNDSLAFIKTSIENDLKGYSLHFFIQFQNQLVGTIDLREITIDNSAVGYWIDEAFQGKSIVSGSLRKLIAEIINNRITKKITLGCNPQNLASAYVAKACGFNYLKTLKNAENLYGEFNDLAIYELKLLGDDSD